MPLRTDPEWWEKAVELALPPYSLTNKAIARVLNRHPSTVDRALALSGVRTRREPVWWERVRKLKRKGLTYPEIAAELGVALSSVSYVLNPKERERKRRQWLRRKADAKNDHGAKAARLPVHGG